MTDLLAREERILSTLPPGDRARLASLLRDLLAPFDETG
jgi:hypothetical protein